MGIRQLLGKLDILGAQIDFRIANRRRHKTCLGCCISLIFVLALVAISFYYYFKWLDVTKPRKINVVERSSTSGVFEDDLSTVINPLFWLSYSFDPQKPSKQFKFPWAWRGVRGDLLWKFIPQLLRVNLTYTRNIRGMLDKDRFRIKYKMGQFNNLSTNSTLWRMFQHHWLFTSIEHEKKYNRKAYLQVDSKETGIPEDPLKDINEIRMDLRFCRLGVDAGCSKYWRSMPLNIYFYILPIQVNLKFNNFSSPSDYKLYRMILTPLSYYPANYTSSVQVKYSKWVVKNVGGGKKINNVIQNEVGHLGGQKDVEVFDPVYRVENIRTVDFPSYNQEALASIVLTATNEVYTVTRVYWTFKLILVTMINLGRSFVLIIAAVYLLYNQESLKNYVLARILNLGDADLPGYFRIESEIKSLRKQTKKLKKKQKIEENLKRKLQVASMLEEFVDDNTDLSFLFSRDLAETGIHDTYLPPHYEKLLPLAVINGKVGNREKKQIEETNTTKFGFIKKFTEVATDDLKATTELVSNLLDLGDLDEDEPSGGGKGYVECFEAIKEHVKLLGEKGIIDQYILENYPVDMAGGGSSGKEKTEGGAELIGPDGTSLQISELNFDFSYCRPNTFFLFFGPFFRE